ncbi:MAG: alkaline phosphatase [Verrucomicrobiota bacterium]|jgi:alkaline phosphatase D
MKRRAFIVAAASWGAAAVWGWPVPRRSQGLWRERRELFPEGVASGDPDSNSVLFWTRYSGSAKRARLTLEVAEDELFERVTASAPVTVSPAADWTCRVLVGGLKSSRVYWYRFSDGDGNGSRIGRTITAPDDDDPRDVRFAVVSCQNANQGAQNAYRRMIFEDLRAPADEQLDFVLHLGDFIYEIVWYPEDRPQGMYDRKLRDIVRYPNGEKIQDFHIPTTLDDYRAVYRAYLHDPDLQDARARWPFVCMWDNHEYSWLGYQGLQVFDGKVRPAQTKKVAANQAWFEFQPARISKPSGPALDEFKPPKVVDAPVEHFDDHGLGQEPNNLTAINSLTGYRTLRWGRNVELLITDQRSYRSEDPGGFPGAEKLGSDDFPYFAPEEVMKVIDAGRAYNKGKAPKSIRFGETEVENLRRNASPQTILGAKQKEWFIQKLRASKATWKIWGNSIGTLDMRVDLQNLPDSFAKKWPAAGFACAPSGDWANAYTERAEIYEAVRQAGITGFATVAGDRHSFWAGVAASALPPDDFDPVGIAFITGSISAPGLLEAMEHKVKKDLPTRALLLADFPDDKKPKPTLNLLVLHGVRSCLEYAKSGDVQKARALSNPEVSPHLSFADIGGHGYATVRVTSDAFTTEFVCIPRPLDRSPGADGGPINYRVSHHAKLWRKGEKPVLTQRVLEGNADLCI